LIFFLTRCSIRYTQNNMCFCPSGRVTVFFLLVQACGSLPFTGRSECSSTVFPPTRPHLRTAPSERLILRPADGRSKKHFSRNFIPFWSRKECRVTVAQTKSASHSGSRLVRASLLIRPSLSSPFSERADQTSPSYLW